MGTSKAKGRQTRGGGKATVGGQPVRGMTNASGPGGNASSQPVMDREKTPGSKSKGLTKAGR